MVDITMQTPQTVAQTKRKPILLKSKFYKPRQTSDSVIRYKLCQSILQKDNRVVLVTAPAGFGKSVLLSQLHEVAKDAQMNATWLTIDRRDNDITRFLVYIYEAFSLLLQNSNVPSPDHTKDGFDNYFAIRDEVINLIDEIASNDTPFILFIDDLEVVTNPEVLEILQDLIECLQKDQRIFIGTRNAQQLALKKLEINGDLIRLGMDDLRFSLEETKAFIVGQQGLKISDDYVDIIHKKTHGWIAGLRLVTLSLQGRRDYTNWIDNLSGHDANIADYLSENVLQKLSSTAREFLIKSSIFETMNSDLCNFVFKRNDSHDILYGFEKANLFISRIPSSFEPSLYAYKLHALFRDFLQQELEKLEDSTISELHKRAAVCFKKRQRYVLAVDHALKSNDYHFAAAIMNKCITHIVELAQLDTVSNWLKSLPKEISSNYINIQRSRIYVMIAMHRYQEAEDALLNCRHLIKSKGATETQDEIIHFALLHEYMDRHDLAIAEVRSVEDHNKIQSPLLSVVSHNITAYHHMAHSKFDEALKSLSTAKKVNQILPASISWASTYSHCFEGWVALIQGDAYAAAAKFEHARKVSKGIDKGVSSVCLAQTYYEADDRLAASSLINQRLKIISDTADIDMVIIAYRLVARCAYQAGDLHAVEVLLSQLGDIGDKRGVSRPKAAAWLEKSRMSLLKGDFESATHYLELGAKSDTWKNNSEYLLYANELENPACANVRLQILTGQAAEAVPLLEMLVDNAGKKGRLMKRTHLQLLFAQALWASGNTDTALGVFKSVLVFCQNNGFFRTLVDEPWYLKELIEHIDISDYAVSELFLQKVKNAIQSLPFRTSAMIEAKAIQNPLTKRENTLILLVGDGRSNKEIANLLAISENTVETHLKKINQKLGTRKRTEAVKKAREQGIIS